MEIIPITNPAQLPKGVNLTGTSSREEAQAASDQGREVYALTRLHPKEYTEYLIVPEKRINADQ